MTGVHWFYVYIFALCMFAGVGIAYLLRAFVDWLDSKIDDSGEWID